MNESVAELAGRTPSLSLCMIVRDEAYFLEECLLSARPHVDEIVVLDTGSVDDTLAIARRHADRVDSFRWIDDFAAARNASLALAEGDWILVLDADERVSEADYALIRRTIADTEKDGFYCVQRNYDDNPNQANWHRVTQPEPLSRGYLGYEANPILRLFRNRPDIRYHGAIHEVVDKSLAEDKRGVLPVALHHYIDADPGKPRAQRQLRYLELLEAALASEPSGRHYRQAAGVRMYFLQDFARAAEYFLKAAELGEAPQASREGAAEAFYRAGDAERARAIYGALYDEGYAPPTLCNNYANLLVRRKEHQRAIEVLRTALNAPVTSAERRARIESNIAALQRMVEES